MSLRASLGSMGDALQEQEANDAPANAMLIHLGDQVNGAIDRPDDVDYYAIDLTRATQLDFELFPDAPFYNPTQWLLDTDGQTLLSAHDWESTEHRIRFTVPATGRYFVRIGNYRDESGAGYGYRLALHAYVLPQFGPGDPVSDLFRSTTIPVLYGVAAGSHGEVYATFSDGVLRLSPTGETTTLATGMASLRGGEPPSALAVDRAGNVLVVGCRYPDGIIWRISAAGERTVFYSGAGTPQAITIGPDGDVWVYDSDDAALWRFDAAGNRKETIGLVPTYAVDIGFSPVGELCFTAAQGLYRLAGTTPTLVAQPKPGEFFADFAFDADGDVYVVVGTYREEGPTYRIARLDAQYHVAQDPVAQVGDHFDPSTIGDLAFARAINGDATTRLLTVEYGRTNTQPAVYHARIAELLPAAIATPGWVVGDAPAFTAQDIVAALLGAKPLTAASIRLLDGRGNANGVLDVGDLRAYLRAQSQLSPQ